MPIKKQSMEDHGGPMLAIDFEPFLASDKHLLEELVTPMIVSEDQFVEFVQEMNAACLA